LVRATLSVIAGLVVWVLVVTLAGFVMRAAWPSYAAVADAMTLTLPMMIVRLAIGAVATFATGLTASAIARQSMVPPLAAGILLLLAFIPQHVMIWEKFPVWYHLTFLLSLVPLASAGGRLKYGWTGPTSSTSKADPF
jgi:hypothetical protein